MIPELFRIGPFPVNSFGLMVALAMAAALLRVEKDFARAGIGPGLAERYVLVGTLTGLLGARLWHCFESAPLLSRRFLELLFASSSGFTFYGGFLLAAGMVVLMTKYDKIPTATVADAAGPGLMLMYLVGRLGCQLSGDGDYGLPTTGWFGMSYAHGVVPTGEGVRAVPTPLLESAATGCALLWFLRWHEQAWCRAPWRRFALYLALMSTERFFVEFLRREPRILAGLTAAQVVAVAGWCVAAMLAASSASRGPRQSTAESR